VVALAVLAATAVLAVMLRAVVVETTTVLLQAV